MKVLRLTIAFIFLFAGTALAQYTYDGDIDPNEFTEWSIMADHKVQSGPYMYVCVINPDKQAEIQIAIIVVNMLTYEMETYGYLKGNAVRFFDLVNGKYTEYFPPKQASLETKDKMKEILATVRGAEV